jgi:hypothetical protein
MVWDSPFAEEGIDKATQPARSSRLFNMPLKIERRMRASLEQIGHLKL